ncbi:hypothetical protein MIMGU_mgv1a008368mg [Erythranthe guttata]|uniref:F-box domain-containing protein n=1 Tax=Erythranthe guttata TaxID=4155 RepID=A0A022RVP2_ERYGU|nr:hypothetical protein MIMGU_mgv1a008368mg [Erythranthe guttata]
MEKILSKFTQEDSIDRLPDELLISIVSRLPVIEAERTNLLSRRWRYFSMFSSILDFDASRVLFKLDQERTSLKAERRKFVRWVNRVVSLHSGEAIEEFRISFDLDKSDANDICKWLKFAFEKKVKRLELNLIQSYTGLSDAQYTFPNMYDSVECSRILPLGISSCESLVKLSLIEVEVTEETLNFFVSNCPLLEELCIIYSSYLKKLTFNFPLIRLRRLEIASTDLPKLKKLVLDIMRPSGYESLLCFTPLMSVAPSLRELVLKLQWSENFMRRTIHTVKAQNRHLGVEVLQIEGFAGGDIDVELAEYVIENAPSLKKIVIDFRRIKPNVFRKYENVMAKQGEADIVDSDRMAIAREGAALLKAKLAAGVELIIR